MGLLEKIKEIEFEISRTQKNKATEYHLGQLKAKLAKYRSELFEPSGKGKGYFRFAFLSLIMLQVVVKVSKSQNSVMPESV